ncbi:leucine-rich repeat protein [Wenyingzhuangia sp. IMCC45574]
MKKKLLITLAFFLGFNSLLSAQTTFTVDDIKYEITSSTAPLTVKTIDYTGSATAVTIPETITYDSNGREYTVNEIGYFSFSNKNLTSVTIPNSVTTIEGRAFQMNNLTSVTIPSSVTSIEGYAFFNNDLTSIALPNSLTTIGATAFGGNDLTSIALPNSLTTIGHYAFQSNKITSITIPNSVTSIGWATFAQNQLTSVTISSSVTSIEGNAFNYNPSLNTVISKSKTPATISSNVFPTFSNIDLTIPTGTLSAYTSAGWTGFKSITEDGTLSHKEIELNKDISIAITSDKISVTNLTNVVTGEIIIYNAVGKEVKSNKAGNIDISSLSAGLYVLQLKTNKGVFSKKFAK